MVTNSLDLDRCAGLRFREHVGSSSRPYPRRLGIQLRGAGTGQAHGLLDVAWRLAPFRAARTTSRSQWIKRCGRAPRRNSIDAEATPVVIVDASDDPVFGPAPWRVRGPGHTTCWAVFRPISLILGAESSDPFDRYRDSAVIPGKAGTQRWVPAFGDVIQSRFPACRLPAP
jgi:hypothetical protein